ncbi:hypothetical protein BBAD15_g12513 [Beauveria bassiana D1-5]|uniref:Uncharacterized protein n=1 Tax=Beauveria bassiana D1-5 TaxID=1245745 RepID=A0A0A2V483_BEABA|nr:hypothetical protein BBAD15_g12513 [Beauveria bassiana D1-5]
MMKPFIALLLLAAAALAAPELPARNDATKPVKEADTSRADCWKNHGMLPAKATHNEDCTGTIEYCLRGFYSSHGEEFDNADDCLRSRGLDPATAGLSALEEANELFNRYMLLTRFARTSVSDENDKEGNDFINRLQSSNNNRVFQAREMIRKAKYHLKRAFGLIHDEEIEAGIEVAKGNLTAAWDEVQMKDVNQLRSMRDWFKERSEEKYFHNI